MVSLHARNAGKPVVVVLSLERDDPATLSLESMEKCHVKACGRLGVYIILRERQYSIEPGIVTSAVSG
jgi:hypothetical protein